MKIHQKYLKEQFYPGNDTESNNVYSSIINHFRTKSNKGGRMKKPKQKEKLDKLASTLNNLNKIKE